MDGLPLLVTDPGVSAQQASRPRPRDQDVSGTTTVDLPGTFSDPDLVRVPAGSIMLEAALIHFRLDGGTGGAGGVRGFPGCLGVSSTLLQAAPPLIFMLVALVAKILVRRRFM
jgi:hypothetical protein